MDRYEKVDAYTIRVIQEKVSDVALVNLIKTRNDMLEDIKGLQVRLESLEVIIAKAKRLGIVPKKQSSVEGKPTIIKPGETNDSNPN